MAAAGDRIDRFTLVRQLGAGGMGQTWEAVRQAGHEFEQRVAIKLADPETLDCAEGLEAFRREAALAASLRHPNIAAVLDVDERAGYIVCELVDGADLRSVLRAVPGGRLDVAVLVHVIGQIARGLSHAHRRILRGRRSPVIHRDMSPSNVVVDYDGNVKIVDFGLAKACNGSDAAEAIKGKLAYMAPEQAMGGRMDGRVDQYALGVIAYEALSGVRPNDGADDGETLACILGGKHVPLRKRLPQLDPTIAAIIERMLERNPDQRFPSMDAVLDAFAQFTPPFTIHRELIPLVIHARQPHTILRENGRFVSRPVESDDWLVGADTPSQPSVAGQGAAAARARGEPVDWPSGLRGRGDAAPRGAKLALGSDRAGWAGARSRLDTPSEPSAPQSARQRSLATTADASERKRPAAAVPRGARSLALALANTLRPAAAHSRNVRPRAAARVDRQPDLGARLRRWADRMLASRTFWQGLTVLGAVLLALVAWIAMSPDLLLSLAPVPARTRPPASVHTQRGPTRGEVHVTAAQVVEGREVGAQRAAAALQIGAATSQATASATAPSSGALAATPAAANAGRPVRRAAAGDAAARAPHRNLRSDERSAAEHAEARPNGDEGDARRAENVAPASQRLEREDFDLQPLTPPAGTGPADNLPSPPPPAAEAAADRGAETVANEPSTVEAAALEAAHKRSPESLATKPAAALQHGGKVLSSAHGTGPLAGDAARPAADETW